MPCVHSVHHQRPYHAFSAFFFCQPEIANRIHVDGLIYLGLQGLILLGCSFVQRDLGQRIVFQLLACFINQSVMRWTFICIKTNI